MQPNDAIARHIASPSERATNTLAPPIANVERLGMKVPMWNSGPELRNTLCSSMPCHGAMSAPCASNARDESIAAFGRPVNAAV